jgi:hypothetical protein
MHTNPCGVPVLASKERERGSTWPARFGCREARVSRFAEVRILLAFCREVCREDARHARTLRTYATYVWTHLARRLYVEGSGGGPAEMKNTDF